MAFLVGNQFSLIELSRAGAPLLQAPVLSAAGHGPFAAGTSPRSVTEPISETGCPHATSRRFVAET